jgi:hypothetical protein
MTSIKQNEDGAKILLLFNKVYRFWSLSFIAEPLQPLLPIIPPSNMRNNAIPATSHIKNPSPDFFPNEHSFILRFSQSLFISPSF